jgi:hypothetical protein
MCDSSRVYLETRAAELDAQTAAIARQRERVQAHLGTEHRFHSDSRVFDDVTERRPRRLSPTISFDAVPFGGRQLGPGAAVIPP